MPLLLKIAIAINWIGAGIYLYWGVRDIGRWRGWWPRHKTQTLSDARLLADPRLDPEVKAGIHSQAAGEVSTVIGFAADGTVYMDFYSYNDAGNEFIRALEDHRCAMRGHYYINEKALLAPVPEQDKKEAT